MDFFKFNLCLDQIEIVCVVSGPCWCSILKVWESKCYGRPGIHFTPSGKSFLRALTQALHAWVDYGDQSCSSSSCVASKGAGEREGGWEKGRWKDHNTRKDTISQTWKDLFYGVVSGRKPSCPWGERNYQKKLFKKLLFPAYHTGLPRRDFICLFFKEPALVLPWQFQ